MFIPIFLISIPALAFLRPYGSLIWFAGVLLLWATRYTHQLGERWGRAYYGLSMTIRPLGMALIAFGWLVLYAPQRELERFDPLGFSYERVFTWPTRNWAVLLCWVALALFFTLGVWSVIKLGLRRSFLYRRVDDPLVTTGPYALVRHPQFLSAMGLAAMGTVLANMQEYGAMYEFGHLEANTALFILALWILAVLEDRELAAHFGGQHGEYAKRVRRVFPN